MMNGTHNWKIKIFLSFMLFIFLIGCQPLKSSAQSIEQSFTDIHNDFWARSEVTQLVEMGVINGYPDKQFRPALPVSRGQAANLLANALKLPEQPYRPIFRDVSSKSSYVKGAMATYEAGVFVGKQDGNFGVADQLTREQMATVLVRAFQLEDTGEAIQFSDEHRISPSHKEGVKILAQHGITTGKADGSFDPKTPVNRATYVVFLQRAMVKKGLIEPLGNIQFAEAQTFGNYEPVRGESYFVEVPVAQNVKTYLRSNVQLYLNRTTSGKEIIYRKQYPHAKDITYVYRVPGRAATSVWVTKREFPNGDYFLFTTIRNHEKEPLTVDLIQTETKVTRSLLHAYNRFPIKKDTDKTFGFDITTYPTGLFERTFEDGSKAQQMIGKVYRSSQLTMTYPNGAYSETRELHQESEAFSGMKLGDVQLSVYRLESKGNDIVDHWMNVSDQLLFSTKDEMNSWMIESVANYKKRNKWYTAKGPYNKMAVTIEPMPSSGQGYGRNLLLVKEDRALQKYLETKERYYENLLYNSFVNLEVFRKDDTYWETEITSTYLKGLFGLTAPFVDTRFNEQIALFLYNGGKAFGHKDYNTGLKNYANLLVEQTKMGNVIRVNSNAYYIPDYFSKYQKVKTHSSMNHLLGGMNILLLAYQEFKDPIYLETATAIQRAIEVDGDKWIRPDGDIWYKISPDGTFVGRDYRHLTVEDLILSYENWSNIDPSKVGIFEKMIRSKTAYLDRNRLGYSRKMKEGLERIGMSELLPEGREHIDAL